MNSKTNILVTGGSGQLGSCLKEVLDAAYLNRHQLDITEEKSVSALLKNFGGGILINCAAFTDVEAAQDSKDAFLINHRAVEQLAKECKKNNIYLIHISTDFVFDGYKNSPYFPDDKTNPLNVYGKSKRLGEQSIESENSSACIIRTSWLYSEFGKNFVKTMLRLFKEKDSLNIVEDQVGCPTYARDLAEAITQITRLEKEERPKGIFHFSNAPHTTWLEFATEIARQTQSAIKLNPVKSIDYPSKASRPHYSVLDTSSLNGILGTTPNNWKESLAKCLKRISL